MIPARIFSACRMSLQQITRRKLATGNVQHMRTACMSHSAGSAYEPRSPGHTYLKGLLDEDDADAPWHRESVDVVNREVQDPSHLSVHESW
ncbi:hypothetical protein H4S08_004703 [Coemansia sp. RSA 1365]|nr:hypothetical protein H4S08_004703 [Coemansia sp. RSA 1365]